MHYTTIRDTLIHRHIDSHFQEQKDTILLRSRSNVMVSNIASAATHSRGIEKMVAGEIERI
ncbi:hypothetical protein X777_02279 [Ooceraea biroi]|uniref:Uncharacterized protein n=1 Tax=Ooceraea biroi TaxID=2015173 RepID=A0A026WKX3_OOCBI|nr:hypothetical protein X777_02279 [Ooceraea biroi]